MSAIAIGIPAGYALEILSFLTLSALDARQVYFVLPAIWTSLGFVLMARRREGLVRLELPVERAGVALALSLLVLVTVLTAASQMFSESPLNEGRPAVGLFHDWVYLLSRAATIKNHWPLEDPSLAGEPLQYHYFMLVHTAAASWVTGTEISLVFLRLVVVPFGIVIVFQAYTLGHRLTQQAWGGVLAALLTLMAGEVSLSADYMDPTYLGLFVRWLFQSPTFFFGMVFFGALLVAVQTCIELPRCTWRHYLLLALLAGAGTGAKGTVLPPLLISLGILIGWQWLRHQQMPRRLLAIVSCLAATFVVVYALTMAGWGSGDAVIAPFQTLQVSRFWRESFPVWQSWLAQWCPAQFSTNLAAWSCLLVVFLGTAGLRAFALPYLLLIRWQQNRTMTIWLGLVFGCCFSMGLFLHLVSYSQLYILLLMRLPLALLAAAFMVEACQRCLTWMRPAVHAVTTAPAGWWMAPRTRAALVIMTGTGGLALLVLQVGLWHVRNRPGLHRWFYKEYHAKSQMQPLQEALIWVRAHTEHNATLISNVFTPENLRRDRWGALDRTKIGLHFYYSALAERRLWVEGPIYSRDPKKADQRMRLAADIFYHDRSPTTALFGNKPCYILLDRTVQDGARVPLTDLQRVFANERIEVYRVPSLLLATHQVETPTAAQP
ncbi:MAG: hypothetical protein HZA31_05745 [Opitutae bacterium]|nr:hypothetical protein [Opitutae bacterium]